MTKIWPIQTCENEARIVQVCNWRYFSHHILPVNNVGLFWRVHLLSFIRLHPSCPSFPHLDRLHWLHFVHFNAGWKTSVPSCFLLLLLFYAFWFHHVDAYAMAGRIFPQLIFRFVYFAPCRFFLLSLTTIKSVIKKVGIILRLEQVVPEIMVCDLNLVQLAGFHHHWIWLLVLIQALHWTLKQLLPLVCFSKVCSSFLMCCSCSPVASPSFSWRPRWGSTPNREA